MKINLRSYCFPDHVSDVEEFFCDNYAETFQDEYDIVISTKHEVEGFQFHSSVRTLNGENTELLESAKWKQMPFYQ